MLNVSSNVN